MADATTLIGSTITVNGSFASEEDVSVQGKIQGEIKTTADIYVEENGTIEAEISTRSIDVHGTVVGNIVAADRIQLHAGASVTGDMRAPRVILADGAKYKGHIDMVDSGRG